MFASLAASVYLYTFELFEIKYHIWFLGRGGVSSDTTSNMVTGSVQQVLEYV